MAVPLNFDDALNAFIKKNNKFKSSKINDMLKWYYNGEEVLRHKYKSSELAIIYETKSGWHQVPIDDFYQKRTNKAPERRKIVTIFDYVDFMSSGNYYFQEWLQELQEYRKRGTDPLLTWFENMKDINKDPTLVEIGEDIKLTYLTGVANVKFIPKPNYQPISSAMTFSYNAAAGPIYNTHLNKGDHFVFQKGYKFNDNSGFQLFEYPKDNNKAPIKPKTDLFLYLASSIVNELDEVLFCNYGIQIMKKFTSADALKKLETRFRLFKEIPSATNTVLLFQVMDAIILDKANAGALDSFIQGEGEKTLKRLEKLKSLALSSQYHEERKLAAEKCFESFQKLIGE